jgi:hypothetical protein
MGKKAEYLKISGNGSNALDFHIAFYIGQLAAQDPKAYFHIISKDTGFDPLIQHLKSKKIWACRSRNITDMPLIKAANSQSPSEELNVVVSKLLKLATSKPKTVKSLGSTISSIFQKKLTEDAIAMLIKELETKGHIVVTDKRVAYTHVQK